MRVAVVGHVEWVRFLPVDASPAPGVILHAEHGWAEPAGGGGAAALELARLEGRAELYTAVGDDETGRAIAPMLAEGGVRTFAAVRSEPHRQALTFIAPDGERTITVVGPAQQPVEAELDPSCFVGMDAVYFCKGDVGWLRAARQARVLVATARVLPVLREAGVRLDALVRSAADPSEAYEPGSLLPAPSVVVCTDSERGGRWWTSVSAGRWRATALPGPVEDAYGCGDCFAAGLTWALARGLALPEALELAASRGALALTRRGVGLG